MKWRCANEITGYCSEKPEWGSRPKKLGEGKFLVSGSCKLDPETCGKFRTLSQQLEGVVFPKPQYKIVGKGRIVKIKDDKTL